MTTDVSIDPQTTPPASPAPAPPKPARRGWFRTVIGVLLPLAVLGGGAWLVIEIYHNKPTPKQRPRTRRPTSVRVEPLKASTQRIVVHAMGTVTPARRIMLQPQVSGRITARSDELLPGGLFATDQFMFQIDPADYEFSTRQKAGEVARAELAWKLELGQQDIALSEYKLLSEGKAIDGPDKDLILRKPHLAMARDVLDAAKAAKAKADLDVTRTEITAPFNAMILAKHADLGAQVSPSSQLAALVGTDEYWIQVSMPVNRLKWLSIPRAGKVVGSRVRIFNDTGWPTGAQRTGHVTRLVGDLDAEGRMAKILVTVTDPLGLKTSAGTPKPAAMLIGMFLRVEIDGAELDGVFSIPRTALRNGKEVWLMGDDGKLDIRKVEIVWRGRERILIHNSLSAGERLIVSDLAVPTRNMPLVLEKPKTDKVASQPVSRAASRPAPREVSPQ